jgi:hypothetical protein
LYNTCPKISILVKESNVLSKLKGNPFDQNDQDEKPVFIIKNKLVIKKILIRNNEDIYKVLSLDNNFMLSIIITNKNKTAIAPT